MYFIGPDVTRSNSVTIARGKGCGLQTWRLIHLCVERTQGRATAVTPAPRGPWMIDFTYLPASWLPATRRPNPGKVSPLQLACDQAPCPAQI